MPDGRTSSWLSRGCLLIAALLSTCTDYSLAATTTYTGPWGGGTIAPGNTVVLNNGASVTGNVVANGTLQFNQTAAMMVTRRISGTGALAVTNTGTVVLQDASSSPPSFYSDLVIRVSAGALAIGSSGTASFNLGVSGTGTLDVTGGRLASGETYIGGFFANQSAGLAAIRGGRWDVRNLAVGGNPNSNFAGRGTLSISDGGVVAVTGTLSRGAYGTINLNNGGTLQIGTGGTTGVLGVSTLTNDGTLIFDRSDDSTYAGVLSGTGALKIRGAGALLLGMLGARSTFTGVTLIETGSLAIINQEALGSASLIEVASDATFDASRLTSGYTVSSGQTIAGSGTVLGSVTFGRGSTLSPGMFSTASGASMLAVDTQTGSLQALVVPEPATLGMVGVALGFVGLRAARRRRAG